LLQDDYSYQERVEIEDVLFESFSSPDILSLVLLSKNDESFDPFLLNNFFQALQQKERFFVQCSEVYEKTFYKIISTPNQKTTHFIRSLFVFSLCYPLLIDTNRYELLIELVHFLNQLSPLIWSHLTQLFLDYPDSISQFLNSLQLGLDILATKSEEPLKDEKVLLIVSMIHKLFLIAQVSDFDFELSRFSSHVFSSRLPMSRKCIKIIRNYFSVVSIKFKFQMLRQARKESQRRNPNRRINQIYFDDEDFRNIFQINVSRHSIADGTIKVFSGKKETILKGSLKVSFSGENGIDS
jgi:hypothetical protein